MDDPSKPPTASSVSSCSRPDGGRRAQASQAGAFLATTIAFFLAEIGDKTQIATVALAARFHGIALVTAGATTGVLVLLKVDFGLF